MVSGLCCIWTADDIWPWVQLMDTYFTPDSQAIAVEAVQRAVRGDVHRLSMSATPQQDSGERMGSLQPSRLFDLHRCLAQPTEPQLRVICLIICMTDTCEMPTVL